MAVLTPVVAQATTARSLPAALKTHSAAAQPETTKVSDPPDPQAPENTGAGFSTTETSNGVMKTVISTPPPSSSDGASVTPDYGNSGQGDSNGGITVCAIASNSSTPDCGTGGSAVGSNGSGTEDRLLVSTGSFTSDFPTDSDILSAQLNIGGADEQSPSGSTGVLQAYAVTQPWSNPTWTDASSGVPWTAGGAIDTSTAAYQVPGYSLPLSSFGDGNYDITQLFSNWLSGSTPNDGLLLKSQNEANDFTNYFQSAPAIEIYWTPYQGADGTSAPLRRNLTDSLSASVNSADGNLCVIGKVMNLAGIGQGLSLNYAINGTAVDTTTNFDGYSTALADYMGAEPAGQTDISLTYTAPDGEQETFIRSGPTTYTSPPTLNATLTVNAAQSVWKLTFNSTGITNTYTRYGIAYNNFTVYLYSLQSSTDTHGNTLTYTYANGSDVSSITDTQGRTIDFTYEYSKVHTVTDTSLSRTVTFNWVNATETSSPYLSSVTDADGKTTTFGYDGSYDENLTSITDPDGHVTAIAATTNLGDAIFAQTNSITFGSGSSSPSKYSWAYPTPGTTTLTDPNGGVTTYYYNTLDEVTNTKDPLGHTVAGTWSPQGESLTSTDGLSNVTTNTFEPAATADPNTAFNQLTSTAPTGTGTAVKTSQAYPAANGTLSDFEPSSATDAEGNKTTYSYNSSFEMASSTSPAGAGSKTTSYHYQGDSGISCTGAKPGELCSSVSPNGSTTSYSYDSNGNLTTVTPPSPLAATHTTYDAAGRPISRTDGRGVTTYTSYDSDDRVTQVSSSATSCPGASCVQYTYNGEGWLTQVVDPSGTTKYTYDAQGRALTENTPIGNTTVTYDGNGNVLTYVDTTGTVGYRYDAANRLTAMWEPGGSCPATPTFPNSTKCTGFSYNADNNRTGTSYPNGETITNGFDNSGRETSVVAKNSGGTVLASRTYSYENGTADTDLRQKVVDQAGNVTSYTYDSLDRVVSATTGSATQSWTYDADGNRLTASSAGTTTYAALNAADELCNTATVSGGTCSSPKSGATTYSYDGAGDLSGATAGAISAATYSTFGQTASTTSGGTVTPDTYSGTSSSDRTESGSTSFIDGLLGVTRETVGSTTVSFIRDSSGNLIAMETGGASYYYTTDGLGSVILLTSSSDAAAASYTYDTWGNTVTATGAEASTNPYRYAGGYTDSNGLVKFGTRYYNPALGRWTQLDPSGQSAGYVYVGDDPISSVDPSGKFQIYLDETATLYLAAALGSGALIVGAIEIALSAASVAGAAILIGLGVTGAIAGIGSLAISTAVFANQACVGFQVNTFQGVPYSASVFFYTPCSTMGTYEHGSL